MFLRSHQGVHAANLARELKRRSTSRGNRAGFVGEFNLERGTSGSAGAATSRERGHGAENRCVKVGERHASRRPWVKVG